MTQAPSISVVIPTFNRVEMLCRVLPSYLKSPLVLEVIVVDDCGSDNTGQQIQQLALSEPRLRYLRNERNLKQPASRNVGASYAHGEWVLQSEDDLMLSDDHLEALLEHAQKTQADIICGRRIWLQLGESEAQGLERANRDHRPPYSQRWLDVNSHATAPDDVEVPLVSATMLMRRQIFDQLQYSVSYKGNGWREDSDLQLSALEKGYKIVLCPHALGFHYSRASQSFGRNRLKGTLVYAYWIYRNNLLFLSRHQDLPAPKFAAFPMVRQSSNYGPGLRPVSWHMVGPG